MTAPDIETAATSEEPPLYTGRPRLSHAMNIAALAFTLGLVAAIATAAYIPESTGLRGYAFYAVGGFWVLAGVAWMIANHTRPTPTAAGTLRNIDDQIGALTAQRAELGGDPELKRSSRRPSGSKPSPHPRRDADRVPA